MTVDLDHVSTIIVMCVMKSIYINFDLGLRGDYDRLYSWLDSMKALECGDSTALIQKTFENDDHNYIYDFLRNEINQKVGIKPSDGIYISFIGSDGQLKGKFLFGGRKRALWEGCAVNGDGVEDSL